MIGYVAQMTVLVTDQAEAKRFYTEKLGFVVRNEIEFAPGWRYLTVALDEESETVIELTPADTDAQKLRVGNQAGDHILIMFDTDDLDRDYKLLLDRGVSFLSEPKRVPGGYGAAFTDLYGNRLDLYQREAVPEER